MRRPSALLLMLLALAGCASQRRPYGELTVPPTPRTIVAVEVTNPYRRSIDVYYSTELLGMLEPYAHRRYSVAPTTVRAPIYVQWTGFTGQRFNLSRSQSVRYVYEDPAPEGRRCAETVCP